MASFFDTNLSTGSGISPLVYFQRIASATRANYEAQFAKRADVKNEIEYFKAKAPLATDPDAFLNNSRLLAVAANAFSIDEPLTYAYRTKAIAKSDANDPDSLLNKFSDQRYREFNLAFDFANKGVTKLKEDATIDLVTRRYVTDQYERSLANLNPILEEAAYFIRKIGEKQNIAQVISDPVTFGVVIDTLGIPRASTGMEYVVLADKISSGFDISRVKDTKYIENFAKRYLAIKSAASALSAGNPLIGMFKSSDA